MRTLLPATKRTTPGVEVAELGEAFRVELLDQAVSTSPTASWITHTTALPRGVRAARLERRSSGSPRRSR
jgi:hypothetical protein